MRIVDTIGDCDYNLQGVIMDYILLYGYLKWRKENSDSTAKKLIKLPLFAKVILVCLVVSVFVGIGLIKISITGTYVSYAVAVILCIISIFYSERMYMNRSRQDYKTYKDYCQKLYEWLKSYDIDSEKYITEIKDRMLKKQMDICNRMEKSRDRFDRWIQVLMIPIFLVIVDYIINNQYNISEKLTYFASALVVFISAYVLLLGAEAFTNVFYNMRATQYQYFIDDLQGVSHFMFSIK